MRTIDLYEFIKNYEIEYHWHNDDVIMFVNNYDIPSFHSILCSGMFDDEGINCAMKDGYFCFMMKQICEYLGIELSDVFKRKEE